MTAILARQSGSVISIPFDYIASRRARMIARARDSHVIVNMTKNTRRVSCLGMVTSETFDWRNVHWGGMEKL